MKKQPRAYKREKRKAQIIGMFAIWQSKGDYEPKTMQRIARSLGLVPAYKVTQMLLELVADGELAFVERHKPGRWTARAYYSTVRELITKKYARQRKVNIKHKGIVAGQLQMWS